jgi:hypothetical protein
MTLPFQRRQGRQQQQSIPGKKAIVLSFPVCTFISNFRHYIKRSKIMAPDNSTTITLKALESYTRDVGRGIARIDYDVMDSLGMSTGDVVEVSVYPFTPLMRARA